MARDEEMMTPGGDGPDELVPMWTSDGHPDEGTIHAWLDEAFDARSAAVIAAHVEACVRCSESVAEARGFIAGASRMVRALDAVPSGVVPQRDVERVASRIVAAASAAERVSSQPTPVVPITAARPRRAWYAKPAFRSAAAVLVMIAGGGYLLSRDPNVAVRETVAVATDSVASVATPTLSAPSVVGERADQPVDSRRERLMMAPRAVSAKAEIASTASAADASVADTNRRLLRSDGVRNATMAAAKAAPPPPAPVTPPVAPPAANAADTRAAGATSAFALESRAVVVPQRVADSGHVVAGRITSASGAPLAGVSLIPNGAGMPAATTDSLGEFRLRVVADTVRLLARRLGYATASKLVDLRGGDSSRVDLRMEPSVQALSAVTVQQPSKEIVTAMSSRATSTAAFSSASSATGCWSLRPSRASAMQLPTHLLVTPPETAGSLSTQWVNWPSRGSTTSVVMSIDRAATLHGMGTIGGDTLELSVTRSGVEWTGQAVERRGRARIELPIVLSRQPESVCKM